VGSRLGCSQRLQDQADITPVDSNPYRPADSAQSALTREKRAFLQPFYTKSRYDMALCWWEVSSCSQRRKDQADITPVDYDSPPPANPAQGALTREKGAFLQPFYTKSWYDMAVCWWEVA
jgi:hypothetical protein